MTESDAQALADHVVATIGRGPYSPMLGWDHMGAVICDSVMQGGIGYDSVVLPRVKQLIAHWPDASTVSRFRDRCAAENLADIIDFNNTRKLQTISDLTSLLTGEGIETTDDLRTWLQRDDCRPKLTSVSGVASKTADYLPMLVGLPGVAVDVHLKAFLGEAGATSVDTYDNIKALYEQAAHILGVDVEGLDHAVWTYMANK